MALSVNSRSYGAMNTFWTNVFFKLGERVGEQVSGLIETQSEKHNPKSPSIFETLPPTRPDIEALLVEHAKARGETYEFYRKRIALIIPSLPNVEDTIESIRANNLVAWEYFFTKCPIETVKKVLDLFDASKSGWVNPQEIAAILAR